MIEGRRELVGPLQDCSRLSETSVCDKCQMDHLCDRLKTGLRILEANPFAEQVLASKQSGDDFKNKYLSILTSLKDAGWNYPVGENLCDFAKNRKDVVGLTDDLIALLEEYEYALSNRRVGDNATKS